MDMSLSKLWEMLCDSVEELQFWSGCAFLPQYFPPLFTQVLLRLPHAQGKKCKPHYKVKSSDSQGQFCSPSKLLDKLQGKNRDMHVWPTPQGDSCVNCNLSTEGEKLRALEMLRDYLENLRKGGRGQQRMRWLDIITNSMDMNSSKLLEIVKNREGLHATVQGVAKNQTGLRDWTTKKNRGDSEEEANPNLSFLSAPRGGWKGQLFPGVVANSGGRKGQGWQGRGVGIINVPYLTPGLFLSSRLVLGTRESERWQAVQGDMFAAQF